MFVLYRCGSKYTLDGVANACTRTLTKCQYWCISKSYCSRTCVVGLCWFSVKAFHFVGGLVDSD